MITIERILFLKKISIFSSLASYELRKIAEVIEEETFMQGEILFSEGEFGDCMYFVVNGKISIFTGELPAIKVLAVFEKGDFFGEMGLYDDKPRAAAALAQSDSLLLMLRKDEFCDLISEFPMVALGIMKELNNRIRATNKKLNLIERNIIETESRLYSREYFIECVKNHLSKARNEKLRVGFMIVNLIKLQPKSDGPKLHPNKINQIKTKLIKNIGNCLNSFIRETDMLSRYTDDKIAIMIPDSNHKSLLKFQARITDDLNSVLIDFEDNKNVSSDLEYKMVVFPDEGKELSEILEKIDLA